MQPIQHNSAAELSKFMEELAYYEDGIYKIIEDKVRFKPKTKQELMLAVKEYMDTDKYGPIDLWDTSLITVDNYLLAFNCLQRQF